jgi:hypothetical protein
MSKLAKLLLAAVAFGVVVAVIKGQNTGARDALGNTSAVWVVVPFLAGTRYARVWQATLVGLATALVAFFGFYLAEEAILDLGTHSWGTRLSLTLGSGHFWEAWGLISGSVYGTLGGIWKSRSVRAAPIAVGLAFVCEPLIVLLLARAGVWGGSGGLLSYPSIWATEVLIGLGGIALVLARTQRTR